MDTQLTELQYFLSKEGDIPFWDHPSMYGYKKLPKNYFPFYSVEQVLRAYKQGQIDDTDIMILKVVGDAVAANEDQLRRYLSSQMSRSEVSERLERLRKNAMVDRWFCRLDNDEDEEFKPPAPFTLGVGGFKLLRHFYNDQPFMNPNTWDSQNAKTLQRYVAMNELRCRLVESRAIKGWTWNGIVAHNRRYKKPFGVAELETGQGRVNFIIERAQMSQNFVGFLRDKLHQWRNLFEKQQSFPITAFPTNVPIFILYCSTVSMAEFIHKELMLDTFPFTVWLCVDELIDTDGLSKSLFAPDKEKLRRMNVSFLQED
ncbi:MULTISPECIES: replication-relaxation family protein [Metabacillus]|uniref:replication-relaxation family protein n=1 Tax=Metabacillus TaxID=2675233 RepID=UPI000C7F9D1D|nr:MULTISPECIES: replication-relaxation family protein [Metabacillus]MCM3443586.1 replication-relaxation family protein [Metabacillus halosaccharovorans]PMC34253.1 hypothetical protein CJ195_24360 [Bacillus sp. UMB0899]